MARSGFGSRFRYMQWLMMLAQGEPPAYAEIGRAVAVVAGLPKPISGQTVSAWGWRDVAPNTYASITGLATYLQVGEEWLIKGEGTPPREELWSYWTTARERDATLERKERAVPVERPAKKVVRRRRTR